MRRVRVLKVVLVLVGMLFTAAVYPLITSVRSGLASEQGGFPADGA